MDTKAAILALLSVWGVGTCATLVPVMAQDTEEAADDDSDLAGKNVGHRTHLIGGCGRTDSPGSMVSV